MQYEIYVHHHHLRGVLALPLETNRRIVASGDLPREISGNECLMFRVDELRPCLLMPDLLMSSCQLPVF